MLAKKLNQEVPKKVRLLLTEYDRTFTVHETAGSAEGHKLQMWNSCIKDINDYKTAFSNVHICVC